MTVAVSSGTSSAIVRASPESRGRWSSSAPTVVRPSASAASAAGARLPGHRLVEARGPRPAHRRGAQRGGVELVGAREGGRHARDHDAARGGATPAAQPHPRPSHTRGPPHPRPSHTRGPATPAGRLLVAQLAQPALARRRLAASSPSSAAISSRRRRTSSSWRSMWPSASLEDLAPADSVAGSASCHSLAQRGAGLLGLDQLAQLLERTPSSSLAGAAARAAARRRPRRRGGGAPGSRPPSAREQPDLLVVADRARRGARRARRPRRCAAASGRRAVALTQLRCGGRSSETPAPTQRRGRQHPQRGVHVVDERARAARRRGRRRGRRRS